MPLVSEASGIFQYLRFFPDRASVSRM